MVQIVVVKVSIAIVCVAGVVRECCECGARGSIIVGLWWLLVGPNRQIIIVAIVGRCVAIGTARRWIIVTRLRLARTVCIWVQRSRIVAARVRRIPIVAVRIWIVRVIRICCSVAIALIVYCHGTTRRVSVLFGIAWAEK